MSESFLHLDAVAARRSAASKSNTRSGQTDTAFDDDHLRLGITVSGFREFCLASNYTAMCLAEECRVLPSGRHVAIGDTEDELPEEELLGMLSRMPIFEWENTTLPHRRAEGSWITSAYGDPDLVDGQHLFAACNHVGYDLCEHIKSWLCAQKERVPQDQHGNPTKSICELLCSLGSTEVGPANAFYSHIQSKWPRRTLACMEVAAKAYYKEIGAQSPEHVFFWLDYVTLRQCQRDFHLRRVQAVIKAIGTTIVELDSDPHEYLSRSFCAFEIYCSVVGGTKVLVTANLARSLRMAEDLAAQPVDCKRAQTRRPDDKAQIDAFIETEIEGGFVTLDRIVTECMLEGAGVIVDQYRQATSIDLSSAKLHGRRDGQAIGKLLGLCPQLESLELSSNVFGAEGARALVSAVAASRTLTSLSLRSCQLGDHGVMAIGRALREHEHVVGSRLRHLDLRASQLRPAQRGQDGDLMRQWSPMCLPGQSRSEAEAAPDGLGEEAVREIAAYLGHGSCSLTALDLSCNLIADKGGAELARGLAASPSLTKCNLRGNQLGDAGWCAIFDALRDQSRSKITSWDLSHEAISTRIAVSLAAYMASDTSLTTLAMVGCKIGPLGSAELLARGVAQCPSLVTCDVRHNDIVGDGAWAVAVAVQSGGAIEEFHELPVRQMRLDALTRLSSPSYFGEECAHLLMLLLPRMSSLTELEVYSRHLHGPIARELASAVVGARGVRTFNRIPLDELRADRLVELPWASAPTHSSQYLGVLGALIVSALVQSTAASLTSIDLSHGRLMGLEERHAHTGAVQYVGTYTTEGIAALSQALRHSSVTDVGLRSIRLRDAGVGILATALQGKEEHAAMAASLDLASNEIGAQGGAAIGVCCAKQLAVLDLSDNRICGMHEAYIDEGEDPGDYLTVLRWTKSDPKQPLLVRRGKYTDDGIRVLAHALSIGRTLTTLSLRQNQLQANGLSELSAGIQASVSLTALDLLDNRLCEEPTILIIDRTISTLPAQAAGLKPGDQLLRVHGVDIVDETDLRAALEACRAELEVDCQIRRGAQALDIRITKPTADSRLGIVPRGVNPSGIEALAEALQQPTCVLRRLNLLLNHLSDDMARMLLDVKAAHPTLTTLCGLRSGQTSPDHVYRTLRAGDALLLAAEVPEVAPSSAAG